MTSQSLVNVSDPNAGQPAAEPERPVVRRSSRQSRHLAQAVQLEESGTAPLVRFTVFITSFAVLAFLVWAALTRVEEVASAEGSIVPTGSLQTVQHLEGGLVEQILAHEGQLVQEGEPLIKLSPSQAMADLDQTRAREMTLLLKAERLRAFAEIRHPDFSFAGAEYARLVSDNLAIFTTQNNARESQRQVILSQIDQKRSELALLEGQHKTLQDQVDATTEELKMRENLVERGLVSRVIYLDNKRENARLRGELARVQGQTITAREALAEVQNRLTDNWATLHKQTMDELGVTVSELAQVQETISRLEDRVQRLVVVSPSKGYVKGLTVHNTGAVIQNGGVICEIVPVDRELKVDAKVLPRDIGFVKVGQRVKVKVTTYDFARYGAVLGTLERVSASSFLNEKGEPFFKASVALDREYVGDTPGLHVITPGMTVNAEIITGDKSLLQYMLKPIFTQLRQSFHER
ncbi:MAG: HlyD family type I secretion periplasmic adaptor subunit [Solirubrobacterales bacterium]